MFLGFFRFFAFKNEKNFNKVNTIDKLKITHYSMSTKKMLLHNKVLIELR